MKNHPLISRSYQRMIVNSNRVELTP